MKITSTLFQEGYTLYLGQDPEISQEKSACIPTDSNAINSNSCAHCLFRILHSSGHLSYHNSLLTAYSELHKKKKCIKEKYVQFSNICRWNIMPHINQALNKFAGHQRRLEILFLVKSPVKGFISRIYKALKNFLWIEGTLGKTGFWHSPFHQPGGLKGQ